MNNFLVKIIVVLIFGSMAGAAGFYFWKDNYATRADIQAVQEAAGEEKGDEAAALQAKSSAKAEENRENEAQIINYIEKNINKITGLRIDSAQKLILIKIWFINSTDFYVDYRDSNLILRRVLISQIPEGNGSSYEVLGYFIPGDKGWVLESGRDIEGAIPLKLYEKNEETGEWSIR